MDELKENKIHRLVEDAKMNMKIEQASSRVWTLALNYEKALENTGFQNFL